MNVKLKRLAGLVQGGLAMILCVRVAAQQPQQPPTSTPSAVVKTSVNEVLVPVVVRDAHGHMVETLKKEDFQVFDNGAPQVITGFAIEKRAEEMPGAAASTRTPDTSAGTPQRAAPAQRFIVLLFDDLNLGSGDLMQTQKAVTKLLEAPLPASDMAAVVSTSGTNSGFTRDHAELQKAIRNLRVSNLYRHDSHDCPNIDYYQGDLIVNKNDQMALQAAAADALACANLPSMEQAMSMAMQAAQRAVALGDQDVRVTLDFLKLLVRTMGKAPGQRMIILVSPGFLTSTAEAMALNSQVLDIAAQSSVTISALDARGLYTTNQDASERSSGPAGADRMKDQYRRASMTLDASVIAGLADGTGGTYFHSSNDLEGGFKDLMVGPKCLYLLTFSIADVKRDGAYHGLEVKLNQDGLKPQARRGYFAPKVEQTKN